MGSRIQFTACRLATDKVIDSETESRYLAGGDRVANPFFAHIVRYLGSWTLTSHALLPAGKQSPEREVQMLSCSKASSCQDWLSFRSPLIPWREPDCYHSSNPSALSSLEVAGDHQA